MKLNKELVKKGLNNQFKAIYHMLVFNIISFIIFMLSFIGNKPTGNTVMPGIVPVAEYKANCFFVIFSWILFLILFSVFYTKFFKKDLKKQIELHWIFTTIFLIISAIFCFVEFTIYCIALIIGTDLFATITNYPNNIYIVVLVYMIGYIFVDFRYKKSNRMDS